MNWVIRQDHVGAALWLPSEKRETSRVVQAGLWPMFIGVTGWGIFTKTLRAFHATDKVHYSSPHMYLLSLSSHPKNRGKGIGGGVAVPDDRAL